MEKTTDSKLSFQKDDDELIHTTMHEIVNVVQDKPFHIGGMALANILTTNTSLSREKFMLWIGDVWDYWELTRKMETIDHNGKTNT